MTSAIRSTIVGSLPKPTWLAEPGILYAPWRVAPEQLDEAQRDATRLCVADQLAAGLDVITDGEQRRRHYVWGFLGGVAGVDTQNLTMKPTRGQRFKSESPAARLIGEPTYVGSQAIETLQAVKALTDRPVKVTLPGPMTIVDSLSDQTGRHSDDDLAMIFAKLLNREARELAAAGAAVVQFDEPCFNIYLAQTREWGIEALKRAIDGVEAKTAVHICYGYGGSEVAAWKDTNHDWSHYEQTLPLVAQTAIDQVSIETAASTVDLGVLETLQGKDVLLGLVNVGSERIETPDEIAIGLRKALAYVPSGSLHACTDCGLVLRSRHAAFGKMRALSNAVAIVNAEIGQADS
ncbi:5-methyltetrahydropteroyltriglutamate--homocysteine methyltransferase [Enhydrobacter aerosaccus]|uniref:5-methyltetrahydropteroyltriglutamate--homocysteine methyltransferase n=1 Tax=Enhydrobacter aerosaccus TaxID=225324 RepID=A0A1T4T1N0_9HYPH|nr:methionine synthase [Enhydrobacter aerosaccus]SKA34297.1 5-methyltetrahydropteroyltriglutamate--homocysteine methyltransferase [Enhydrobacter aerosaccus]